MWKFKARPETTLYLAFPRYGFSFNNLICYMKDVMVIRNTHRHVSSGSLSVALTSSACQGRKQSGKHLSVIFPKRERRKMNAETINNNSRR